MRHRCRRSRVSGCGREEPSYRRRFIYNKERTMELSTYLHFNGDCEEAFKFYEQCTGGKIEAMMTHAGTPAGGQVPPEWQQKILHARMKIGDQWLMASDVPP